MVATAARRRALGVLVAALGAGLAATAALAMPPAQTPPPHEQVAEGDADSSPGMAPTTPHGTQPATPTESPSKKLSKSKGVIHPPPTHDPAVVKPPQVEPSGKAVIPPPGTPGGNPDVQPK